MASQMQCAIAEDLKEALHTRSEPRILDAEPDLQPSFGNTGKLSMHFVPEMTQESLEHEPGKPEFLPTEQQEE